MQSTQTGATSGSVRGSFGDRAKRDPSLRQWLWKLHAGDDALEPDCIGRTPLASICEDPGLILKSPEVAWLLNHFASHVDKESISRLVDGCLTCAGRICCSGLALDANNPETDPTRPSIGPQLAERICEALENSVGRDPPQAEEFDRGDEEEGDSQEDEDESSYYSEEKSDWSEWERDATRDASDSSSDASGKPESQEFEGGVEVELQVNADAEGCARTRATKPPSALNRGDDESELPPEPSSSAQTWKELLMDERLAASMRAMLEQAVVLGEAKPSARLLRILYDPADPMSWIQETSDSSPLSRLAAAVLPENARLVRIAIENANERATRRRKGKKSSEDRSSATTEDGAWRELAIVQVLRGYWRATVWPRNSVNDAALVRSCLSGDLVSKSRVLDEAIVGLTSGNRLSSDRGDPPAFWSAVIESCVVGNLELASRLGLDRRSSHENKSALPDRPFFESTLLRASSFFARAPKDEKRDASVAMLWAMFPSWPAARHRPFFAESVGRVLRNPNKSGGMELISTLLASDPDSMTRVLLSTETPFGAREERSLLDCAANPERVKDLDAFFFTPMRAVGAKLVNSIVSHAAALEASKATHSTPASNLKRSAAAKLIYGLGQGRYPSAGELFLEAFGDGPCDLLDLPRKIPGDAFEPAFAAELSRVLSTRKNSTEALRVVRVACRLSDQNARAVVFFAVPWEKLFLPKPSDWDHDARIAACAKMAFLLVCAGADLEKEDATHYFGVVLPLAVAPLKTSLGESNRSSDGWNVDALCRALALGLVHNSECDSDEEWIEDDDDEDVDEAGSADPGTEDPRRSGDETANSFAMAVARMLGVSRDAIEGIEVVSEDSDDADFVPEDEGEDEDDRAGSTSSSPNSPTRISGLPPTKSNRYNWVEILEDLGETFLTLMLERFAPDESDLQSGIPNDSPQRCRDALDNAFGNGFAERLLVIAAVHFALPQNFDASTVEDELETSHPAERRNRASRATSSGRASRLDSVDFWKHWALATSTEDSGYRSIEGLVWRPVVLRLLRRNFTPESFFPGKRREDRKAPFSREIARTPESVASNWLQECERILDLVEKQEELDETPDDDAEASALSPPSLPESEDAGGRPWRSRIERFFPGRKAFREELFECVSFGSEAGWRSALAAAMPSTLGASADRLLWPIELVTGGYDPKSLSEAGLAVDVDEKTEDGYQRQAVAFATAFSSSIDWNVATSSPCVRAMWEDSSRGPFGFCPLGAICALLPSTEFSGWTRAYPFYRTVARQFAFFARRSGGSGWSAKLSDDFEGKTSTADIDRLAAIAQRHSRPNELAKTLDFLRARRIAAGLAARRDRFLLPMIHELVKCPLSAIPFSDPICANCQEPLAPKNLVAFYHCNHAVHVECLSQEILSRPLEDRNRKCAYRCDAQLDFARKHVRLVEG